MPTKRQILHSTITIVVFLGFTELLQYIFDKPNLTQWQIDLFAGASPAQLIYNFIGVVICAPLWEELLFRGFALTGWTKSLGSYTAVSLSAAIWAIIHIQYELFYVVLIFLFGLVIGSLRIRMKSLTVCIFIHMLNNLFSFFYTMYELDMFKEFGKLL